MPLALPHLTPSTIKRAAKLMAAALKSSVPPPVVNQLVSNPALFRALLDELSLFVGGASMKKQVTAGRRQVVFLGNTGPNNAREWAIVQYRNGPNGDGESVMRVSQRLGMEPRVDQPVQWTDKKIMSIYLKHMRHKLSRPGVILMNKLATAKTVVRAQDDDMVYELKVYIENDAQLYRQRTRPVQVNLEKKWQKGTYNHAQAPKLWLYLVNDAAKKYAKENRTGPIDVATRKKVAQEMADDWQIEMDAQLGPMGGATASRKRVQAGTWQEKAKAELEAELGGIETEDTGRTSMRDAITLESTSGRADNGESEWIVFKDMKSAERYAVEYVQEMLDDDPSMFDQKWLKNHVFVSPTDIRLISNEDADSYVDDIRSQDEERLLDEAGMLRAWQALDAQRDKLGQLALVAKDPRQEAKLTKQFDKIVSDMNKLVDKADDKLRLQLAKETAKRLKDDPLEWAEELGFEFDKNRPPWLQIDTRKAAQDAVNTDGVAHFLDNYDGEEVELDSGAVAFGTN